MEWLFCKLWAFITRRELVWLKDSDGEVVLSYAKVDAWGDKVAYRYPFYNMRICKLLEDGTVEGPNLTKFWKKA